MGEIRHLIRQWLCAKRGHGDRALGEDGVYCSRCGKQTLSWEEFGEAVKVTTGALVGAIDHYAKSVRDTVKWLEAERSQAATQEDANIAKAKEILGGER